MNITNLDIIDALRLLELNDQPGRIHRDGGSVVIYMWSDDKWEGFLKCRASLCIGDIIATDWSYDAGIES